MPRFKYRAKDEKGAVIDSDIEAPSRDEAIEKICQLKYYPIHVEGVSSGPGRAAQGGFSGTPLRLATNFAAQLANISKSGIPLISGIKIISEQADNARFRSLLEGIYSKVKDGSSLSAALECYPGSFDAFFISMVKVGEDNGTLPEALLKISDYRKRQSQIRAKIKNALAYPVFLFIVGCFSVVFIITGVMPKLTVLIKNMGMELPRATRILIDITSFMQGNFLWVAFGFALVYLASFALSRSSASRYTLDAFKLRLPLFGKLILESEIVRFSQTLAASLKNGLQILKSLDLAISVLGNEVVKSRLRKCYEDVRNGSSLGGRIRKADVFPPVIGGMIAIGEESGKLTVILEQIAEEYEGRVDDTIKVLMTLIEPVIILLLGLVVGFIVMALLLPVFQMDIIAK